MSTAAMERKTKTNGNKPVSDYSMRVFYIKPVYKCNGTKLATQWTYRGDTYLKVFQDQGQPYVDQMEALAHQLSLENDNIKRVTVYNNLESPVGGKNILYDRNGDVVNGKNLNGYERNSFKKFGLI